MKINSNIYVGSNAAVVNNLEIIGKYVGVPAKLK